MRKNKLFYGIAALTIMTSTFNVAAEDLFLEDGSSIEITQEYITEEKQNLYSDNEFSVDFIEEETEMPDDIYTDGTDEPDTYNEVSEEDIVDTEESIVLEEGNTNPATADNTSELVESNDLITEDLLGDGTDELEVNASDVLETSETVAVQSSEAIVLSKSGLLNKAKPTLEQIRSRYFAIPVYNSEYDVIPNVSVPYSAGRMSAACMEAGIGTLNLYRYVAGLDDVFLRDDLTEDAQYGALVNAANDFLSHDPEQPSGMDYNIYKKGCMGTGSSNLAAGVSGIEQGVMTCISDNGIMSVGHRRWFFNPYMLYTGFGMARSKTGATYCAMKVFDESQNPGDYDFIAWPASGITPNSMNLNDEAWSVGINTKKYHVNNATELKVTISHDGKTWTMDRTSKDESFKSAFLDYSEAYIGPIPYIIFHPGMNNLGKEMLHGIYTVIITGVKRNSDNKDITIKYDVDFRDLMKYVKSVQPLEADNVYDIPIGKTTKLTYTYYPADAEVKKANWFSSANINAYPDGTIEYKGSEPSTEFILATIQQMNHTAWAYTALNYYQPVKGINLSVAENTEMTAGQSKKVTYTYTPSNAQFTEMKWTSSDNTVVSIDQNGVMTAVTPGSAKVTITNIKCGFSKSFNVNVKADINSASIKLQQTASFTGEQIKKFPKITYNGKELHKNVDYTLTFSDNVYPGTAKVTITGINNYSGTVTKTYTIKKKSIENACIGGIGENRRWTGEPITHNVRVKVSKQWLTYGKDFTVNYSNNVNVGTGSVIITGIGNYTGTVTRTFNINPIGIDVAKISTTNNKIILFYPRQKLQTRGYQVQISTDPEFTTNKATYTTINLDKSWVTFMNLKRDTVYYFRIRTYGKVNGEKYYAKWSDVVNATLS